MHTVHVCSCKLPFVKLKLRKLLGAGRSRNIRPAKICMHMVYYVCSTGINWFILEINISTLRFDKVNESFIEHYVPT